MIIDNTGALFTWNLSILNFQYKEGVSNTNIHRGTPITISYYSHMLSIKVEL